MLKSYMGGGRDGGSRREAASREQWQGPKTRRSVDIPPGVGSGVGERVGKRVGERVGKPVGEGVAAKKKSKKYA